jgi:hypothetical protein
MFIVLQGESFIELQDNTPKEAYVHSLYICLAILLGEYTGASKLEEKAFAIFLLIIGSCMVATIFGTVSQLYADMHARSSKFQQKLDDVNYIAKTLGLPQNMKERVCRYYDYKWHRSGGFEEEDFLGELSSSLRAEVFQFIRRDMIAKVPLFERTSIPFINDIMERFERHIFLPNDSIISHSSENKARNAFIPFRLLPTCNLAILLGPHTHAIKMPHYITITHHTTEHVLRWEWDCGGVKARTSSGNKTRGGVFRRRSFSYRRR